MSIVETIGQACRAVAEVFGWAAKRSDLKNSPAMQANAAAERDQKIKDDATKTVAEGNLDEIRRKAAE